MKFCTHVRCEKYKILVGKPQGKRPLRRPRLRGEDNIRINLEELGGQVWNECIWLGTKGPVAVSCEHVKEPSGFI
jgi:hypothetical protein